MPAPATAPSQQRGGGRRGGGASAASLAEAMAALRRRYGAAALRRGDDPLPGAVWATGVPALDRELTPGGLPQGRLSVLAGAHAGVTGRLTLLQALTAVASRSMQVAYVDLAGTLDPGFLADLGADLDACLVVRPPAGALGPGLAMARALVRAGVPWLGVALGSPGAGGPGSGGGAGWEHALTALAAAVEPARAVACISAPGPLAQPLAYASSLTLACHSLGWQEVHGDVVGLRVRLDAVKSKVGAPGGAAAVLLRYPRPQGTGEVLGLPSLVATGGGDAGSRAGVVSVPGPTVLDPRPAAMSG